MYNINLCTTMATHMKTVKKLSDMSDAELFFVDKTPGNQDCVICLDSVGDTDRVILKCGHVFHASCMFKSVVAANNSCPLCRVKVGEKPEGRPDFTRALMRIFIQNEFNHINMTRILKSMFNFSAIKCNNNINIWEDLEQQDRVNMSDDLIELLVAFGLRLGTQVECWIDEGADRVFIPEEMDADPFHIPVTAYDDGGDALQEDLEENDGMPGLEEISYEDDELDTWVDDDNSPMQSTWVDGEHPPMQPGWSPLEYGPAINIAELFSDFEPVNLVPLFEEEADASRDDYEYEVMNFMNDWFTTSRVVDLSPRILSNEWLSNFDNLEAASIEEIMWPLGGSATHPLFNREEAEAILGAVMRYHASSQLDEIS